MPSTITARVPVGRETSFNHVYLRVHRIECVKTTREIDRDEIVVAAVKTIGVVSGRRGRRLVRAKGAAGKSIYAGKFKKGTVKRFATPKVLASFKYGGAGREWPRHYPASIGLIERDRGSMSAIINAAVDAIDDQAKTVASEAATGAAAAAASAMIGGAAAGSVVPIVGTAAGAAAAAAAAAGLNAIKRARAHDVIGFERADFNPASPPRRGGQVGDRHTLTFVGQKGRYKVVYSWEVR